MIFKISIYIFLISFVFSSAAMKKGKKNYDPLKNIRTKFSRDRSYYKLSAIRRNDTEFAWVKVFILGKDKEECFGDKDIVKALFNEIYQPKRLDFRPKYICNKPWKKY